jgi:predicted adenylyl cyclase CyaB
VDQRENHQEEAVRARKAGQFRGQLNHRIMPVEIEIKLRVSDLSIVRQTLLRLGAAPAGDTLETNLFFDTATRDLMATDCALRLRRNEKTDGGGEALVMTYKGPRSEGPIKRREEIEVRVDHFQQTIDLLARLGYERKLTFEKRRQSWALDHCKIELDTLPELGSYVEIECASESAVLRMQKRLGMESAALIVASYPDVVSRYLSEQPGRPKILTF